MLVFMSAMAMAIVAAAIIIFLGIKGFEFFLVPGKDIAKVDLLFVVDIEIGAVEGVGLVFVFFFLVVIRHRLSGDVASFDEARIVFVNVFVMVFHLKISECDA